MRPSLNYSTTSPCIVLPHISDINEKECFSLSLFFFKIYLFMAALGLCCCTWAFSVVVNGGYCLAGARELLSTMVSLAAEHEIQARRL